MQIIEATIHRLEKLAQTHGEGSVVTTLRQASLPIDETLESVCRDLLALYNRSSDSSGSFGQDPDVHVFPVRFDDYLAGFIEFPDLTEIAVRLISREMENSRLSSGGHALFLRYQEQQNDFFLIAMLKLKAGAGISEDLVLEPTLNIDLDLLNEAARINITRLRARLEPYLTFIKGGRRNADVTFYFRNALACTNFTNSSAQTKELIAAADDFIQQRDDLATDVERQAARLDMRRRLYECFRDNPAEITLATAAASIHPLEPQEFINFSQAQVDGERRYNFNTRFKPDKAASQSLKRIKGNIGTVSVSFDVEDVRQGIVTYDGDTDAILIRAPTHKLKQEILEISDALAD